MSRWLQNAANFLEKLDDTAAKVIVEQRGGDHDDEEDLDQILAARGLDTTIDSTDEPELQGEESLTNAWNEHDDLDLSMMSANGSASEVVATMPPTTETNDIIPDPVDPELQEATPAKPQFEGDNPKLYPETPFQTPRQLSTDPMPKDDPEARTSEHESVAETQDEPVSVPDKDDLESKASELVSAPKSAPSSAMSATAATPAPPQISAEHKQQLLQAQKEIRTLKRHVLSLNQQLEASEHEVEAQRQELESAGALMEKERAKFKADKEKLAEKHQADMKALKQQHDEQMKELQSQIAVLNQQRAQEGGNWSKELEDALVREQETLRKAAMLQDEKETLQQHIDTLEQQQQALGSRLESLTETADSAMEREREAERRLDELLTAHARQIQQRQLREAELEKTVSELGAALVKARESHSVDQSSLMPSLSPDMIMVESLRAEMESIQTQLDQEQQRNRILQDELRSLSSEQSDEATVLQLRREQHDRQIQQLNDTILQLKKDLRREKENIHSNPHGSDGEAMKQVRNLSEEVIRLREKVSSSSSEISTLKSRLSVALDRTKRAEQALEERVSTGGGFGDIEMGSVGNRKRGGKGHPTMRAALKLDVVQGEGTERIAKSLDSLDAFLVQSGKFLRHNAMARLFFILYFVMMHLWTFVLLFFHVHGYETMHSDFVGGGHGPTGILSQHVAQMAQQNSGN